jgi:hypothetical protein
VRRILKSRRGAAIESALFFMLVVFALSMLLVASVTAMGYDNLANERAHDVRREIEQIGLYFVKDTPESTLFEDYTAARGYTVEINGNTLTLKSKNSKVLLYIEKSDQGVTKWRYGDPTPQEQ